MGRGESRHHKGTTRKPLLLVPLFSPHLIHFSGLLHRADPNPPIPAKLAGPQQLLLPSFVLIRIRETAAE